MTSPVDAEVVRRLLALADHARTEPTRALDESAADKPFRRATATAGRRWAARASVLVGAAAVLIALGFVVADRRQRDDRPGEQAAASNVPTTPTRSAATTSTAVPVPALAPPGRSSSPTTESRAAAPSSEPPVTVAPSTGSAESAPTAGPAETAETSATVPAAEVAPVPDGQFLGTVVRIAGDTVTWSVRCGRASDGAAIEPGVASLALDAGKVTADTGNEGTPGSVVLDVAAWRASRTSGLWWATVRGGRVTELVAASLAPARCV